LKRIIAIEYAGQADVYNMEVKDHHNFSICGGLIVHNCDALRYFVAGRPRAAEGKHKKPVKWLDDQWEDYYHASEEDQKLLIQRWGNPFA